MPASVLSPGQDERVSRTSCARIGEEHVRRRDDYLEIAERDFGQPDLSDVSRLQHLILRVGIGLEEHWIAWLDMAIPVLEERPRPT